MGKRTKEESIELIPVKIFREGKYQMSIRFPAKIVNLLDIDPKRDLFVFIVDKKNLHLEGELIDREQYEGEIIE